MQADLLKLGIQAARAGDYQKAQEYFIEVVKSEPSSEKGWLYLGHCLQEQEKRQYCYQKVLKINPANQDARKALASFIKASGSEEKDQTHSSIQPVSGQRAAVAAASKRGKSSNDKKSAWAFRSWLGWGIGLGVFLCIGVVFIFVVSGVLSGQAIGLPAILPRATDASIPATEVIFTSTPTITPSVTPTRTRRPTFTPIATSTLMPSLTPYAGSLPISHWDQIIAEDPKNADAYYRRSDARFYSAVAKGSQDVYRAEIEQALKDIDTAIALSPDRGDYYTLRQRIYMQLLSLVEYRVDTEYIATIALDNAYKAYELGTSLDDYPERIIVINLIDAGRCEDGLREVQKLMANTPTTESSYGGLLHIQSLASACLGRMNDALAAIDASMFNDKNMEFKKSLKVWYLYEMGRYNEALLLINQALLCCPDYGGGRYYLRAAIYYEKGMKEIAEDNLYTGMRNTWGRGGFLPYVEAQFALEEGRKKDAIQLLQYADATLSSVFFNTRMKVKQQLAKLGAAPLVLTPSVPYQATPIP